MLVEMEFVLADSLDQRVALGFVHLIKGDQSKIDLLDRFTTLQV
jgi:hypothetical protein